MAGAGADGGKAGLDGRVDGTFRTDDRRGEEIRRVKHPGSGRLERGTRAWRSGKGRPAAQSEPGKGLFVGGVKLALSLTELGLIDEYEFIVHPRLAGHGPTLFAGLSKHVDLKLVSRLEFGSGAVAMRYEPRR